ncbi:MAG TPA: type II secretion system protein [Clostridiales bacterium]|nr:type II secretion system protein [Clostridiales bacterium]HQP70288.1 type II secretion system protein [Clostridiales bacterium]
MIRTFFQSSNSGRKGITLIEVLVASVILVIAIIPFFMMYTKQNAMLESFRRESSALSVIQERLEKVKSNHDPATLVSLLTPVNQSSPESITINNVNYKLYYEIKIVDFDGVVDGTTHPRLYEIRTVVSWQDSGFEKSISASTRTNEY